MAGPGSIMHLGVGRRITMGAGSGTPDMDGVGGQELVYIRAIGGQLWSDFLDLAVSGLGSASDV